MWNVTSSFLKLNNNVFNTCFKFTIVSCIGELLDTVFHYVENGKVENVRTACLQNLNEIYKDIISKENLPSFSHQWYTMHFCMTSSVCSKVLLFSHPSMCKSCKSKENTCLLAWISVCCIIMLWTFVLMLHLSHSTF